MKIKYLICMTLFALKVNAQYSDTNTTLEYNTSLESTNNITKINLLNLNFGETTIPLNIVYSHNGVQANATESSLGLGWKMEDIGKISRIVNDKLDNKPNGWFNSTDPNFDSNSQITTFSCSSLHSYILVYPDGAVSSIPEQIREPGMDCPYVTESNYNDLSPDFFSLNTSNGLNFDFLYHKEFIYGTLRLVPVLLSDNNNYQIYTNFSNFPSEENNYQTTSSQNVFEIRNVNGDKYDFINGPNSRDIGRSFNSDFRNDYYLKTITNPTKTDESISFTYKNVKSEKRVLYGTGYTDCSYNINDCTQNIISDNFKDYYFLSENRADIETIYSKDKNVTFLYDNHNLLNEIQVFDINNQYVYGYYFIYQTIYNNKNLLVEIGKTNKYRQESEVLYRFEYYNVDTEAQNLEPYQIITDYFGYHNQMDQIGNLFPYSTSDIYNNITYTQNASNLKPNLSFAKKNALKTIINKFSGEIEFDYRLKTDVCAICDNSNIYGGGLLIDTKKVNSINGTTKLIKYEYENLVGNIVKIDDPREHYSNIPTGEGIFWTTRIKLINTLTYYNQLLEGIQTVGSFYKKITEKQFNYNDMSLLSYTTREYEPNHEGIYVAPLLKKEIFKDASNNILKEVVYNYNTHLFQTIPSATYTSQIKVNYSVNQLKKFSLKQYRPIDIVKNQLIEIKEFLYSNNETLANQTKYEYVSPNSNLVSNKIELLSTGINKRYHYVYPDDQEAQDEPNINVLLAKNRFDTPIKQELYVGTEKIAEQKTVYKQDVSTSNLLLPKYEYAKKGDDNNSVLEKKLTYDNYDERGNILQYTTENGIPSCFIWGYNKTKPIVKIENLAIATISASTIIHLQELSNKEDDNCRTSNCKEQKLRMALDDLRSNIKASHPEAVITTFTYDPLVGVTSVKDAKEDINYFIYDSFQKLIRVEDSTGNILTEKEYNYKIQN